MNEIKFINFSLSKYKFVDIFNEGLAIVKNQEGLYGFINKQGEEVIKTEYLDAREFSEDLAAVQDTKTKLWGFINKQGELVIPHQYIKTGWFNEGYASVQLPNGTWNFIDKKGLSSENYSFIASDFKEGYALVKLSGSSKVSFIDKKGNVHGTYKKASPFSNGLAVVEDESKYYIINRNFEIVSTKNNSYFNTVEGNTELMFLAKHFPNYGFLNEYFEETIPIIFEEAEKFSDGMAKVKLSLNWEGYVNKKGKVMPFSNVYQYQELNDFHQGLARVRSAETELYGYIDKQGKEIIKCQYEDADDFSEGLAGVIDIEGVFHFIDKQGKKIITLPLMYYSAIELEDKTITLSAETKEELAAKKLQLLSSLKAKIVNTVIKNIDQLAYDETSEIPESHYVRVRKPNNN